MSLDLVQQEDNKKEIIIKTENPQIKLPIKFILN